MPYKRYARVLYRVYSTGLAILSPVKPVFRVVLRVLTHQKRQVKGHILPLNVPIGQAEQVELSREMLAKMIEQSTAIAAINECMCRTIGGCHDYPQDLGCLILGDQANHLHPGLGRPVTKPEALAIVDRALHCRLTPLVIHMKSDAVLWSLEYERMITVCFCCPCHCLLRDAVGANRFPASGQLTGLPGISILLDHDKCIGCGQCTGVCITNALEVKGGIVSIDSERCVACARCVMACGHGALAVDMAQSYNTTPILQEFSLRTKKNSVFHE